ncbi:hypothetical protein GpartN1_g4387.t1 [Galdieria partita]|uniref:Adenine DNA glycosylase n=1 Tax=Galdieria partita TaxID=83374 RepID=A0A9C7URA6_9RHOD|nr:hypothetical protein GpartN1_g4387.t1 [Galdieria partita]
MLVNDDHSTQKNLPSSSCIRKKRTVSRIKQNPKQKMGDIEDLLKYLCQRDKKNSWLTVEKEISSFQHSLLEWYRQNKRQLPWRQTLMEQHPNPYHIWVSETMLQQTRVTSVIEYYKKWLQTFPDIPSLAASSLERVNEIWAGLGYYRRAKLLYEGAKTIMSCFDGQVPEDIRLLQSIPGIGPYTAAAIASIAFNKPYAVCDGNVFRVLSRLFSIDLDISSSDNQSFFRSLAQFLIFKDKAADYNQAMMELGATVCTPKNFDCKHCPVHHWCNSFQTATERQVPLNDIVGQYPVKFNRVKQSNEELQVYLIVFANYFLMLKNVSRNLLGNLWHFPYVTLKRNGNELTEDEKLQHERCLSRVLHSCGYPLNDTNDLLKLLYESAIPIGQVEHLFTHIKQTIYVKFVRLSSETSLVVENSSHRIGGIDPNDESIEYRWLTKEQMETSAISRQMKKVMELYQQQKKQKFIHSFFC